MSHFGGRCEKEYAGIKGLLRLFSLLKHEQFDFVADLHGVLRSRFLSFCFKLSGVKVAYIDKERGKRKKLTSVENKVLTPQTTSFERYALVFKQLGFSFPLSFHSIFGNEKEISKIYARLWGIRKYMINGLE